MKRTRLTKSILLAATSVVTVACAPAPAVSDSAPLAPSLAQVTGSGEVDGAHLGDVDTCGGCHGDIFEQQQASAHAISSFNNPIYRFGVEAFREAVSKQSSQMCGGCHDIALLVDGAMTQEVAPTDERAHAGVTCRVCHGIESATNDGNGSYTLSRAPLPLPKRGDQAAIDAHKSAARPIDSEALCGSCHRSFLSRQTGNKHFIAGQDDMTAWKSSAWSGNGLARIDPGASKRTCVDCHMPRAVASMGDAATDDDGKIRSHRFLGAHTWMAAMQGNAEQLEHQREFLRGALTVDIAALHNKSRDEWTRPADGAAVAAGERVAFDVVVRNTGVGHSFPAGVKDAVDSWLEVEVATASGRVLGRSGDDKDAHRFRAVVGDKNGVPQWTRSTHEFHAVVVDHTIPARAARVVRYELEIPASLAASELPLQVTASLMHRTRNLELQRAACEASTSRRGKEFDNHREALEKPRLDPCAAQPITTIAATQVTLGGPAAAGARSARSSWERAYEHGMGLLAELPLEAGNARASLSIALENATDASDLERAQIMVALANLYTGAPCGPSSDPSWPTCSGRLDAGLAWLEKAEQLAASHPAIARLRAVLYDRASRWEQAAHWMKTAANAAPDNVGAQRDLARLLNLVGDHREALTIAQRGLRLLPRDFDLLRAQALALEALSAPPTSVTAAHDQARHHARPERPTTTRARCAARDAHCALERRMVHTHRLAPPTDSRPDRG